MTDDDFYRIAKELGCNMSTDADSPEGIVSPYCPNYVFASYNYYGKFVHFWNDNLNYETEESLRNAIIGHLIKEKEFYEAKRLEKMKKDF